MVTVVADVGGDEREGGGRDSVEGWVKLVALLRVEWRIESTVGRVVSSSGVSAIGTGSWVSTDLSRRASGRRT